MNLFENVTWGSDLCDAQDDRRLVLCMSLRNYSPRGFSGRLTVGLSLFFGTRCSSSVNSERRTVSSETSAVIRHRTMCQMRYCRGQLTRRDKRQVEQLFSTGRHTFGRSSSCCLYVGWITLSGNYRFQAIVANEDHDGRKDSSQHVSSLSSVHTVSHLTMPATASLAHLTLLLYSWQIRGTYLAPTQRLGVNVIRRTLINK